MIVQTLRDELVADPLGLGYSADDWAANKETLNAPRDDFVDVQLSDVAARVDRLAGVLMKLDAAAVNEAMPAIVRTSCDALARITRGQTGAVEWRYSDAAVRGEIDALMAGLVTAGVMTQPEADSLLGLGRRQTTRAAQIGAAGFTDHQIKAAMGIE